MMKLNKKLSKIKQKINKLNYKNLLNPNKKHCLQLKLKNLYKMNKNWSMENFNLKMLTIKSLYQWSIQKKQNKKLSILNLIKFLIIIQEK